MNKVISFSYTIILFLLCSISFAIAAETTVFDASAFIPIDIKFQKFSSHFYSELAKKNTSNKFREIKRLTSSINKYRENNQSIEAIVLIVKNIDLIKKNIGSKHVSEILSFLLDNNVLHIANILFNQAQKEGDRSIISTYSFAYAKYYFFHKNWKKTRDIIENFPGDLSQENYHHANLIHGIALQELQKHRLALSQYKKIPDTSKYYTSAQLNMAIANIRQGWWTDAYILINKLLKNPGIKNNSSETDRLYTILGYLFLQQHYYRNSRETFRNVGTGSTYTHKALLGIALSAAYQEDYIGALNAVQILKNKKTYDLPVDEANLLVPYFYEKLQQHTTASAGYNDAVKYFQSRVNNINITMHNKPETLLKIIIANTNNILSINNELLPIYEILPATFIAQLRLLEKYEPFIKKSTNPDTIRNYNETRNAFASFLKITINKFLQKKSSYLASYMSQCRYGMARMYDNSTKKIR